jgi:hypothetical protein
MSKTLRTLSKDQYKALIEDAVTSRREALAEITTATLKEFKEEDIVTLGKKALEAYKEMITLKRQMREDYPPCTCSCDCQTSNDKEG